MMFSIVSGDLDFFAGPNESDHQGKKADGCEDVEDVWHCVRIWLFSFRLGESPGNPERSVARPIRRVEELWHILVFAEVEWFFA
jgi:hypothetical protein